MAQGCQSAWRCLVAFGGLVFCCGGDLLNHLGEVLPDEEADAITFTKWAYLSCSIECPEYVEKGCCQPEACDGAAPEECCHCDCWSMLCTFDVCCQEYSPSVKIARLTQTLMRSQSHLLVSLPPRLCPPSRGDDSLPELPPYEGSMQTEVPFAPGDVVVLVVTSTAALEAGRARAAAKTWVKRFPPHSVFFARAGSLRPVENADLGDVEVLSIPCPTAYWKVRESPISCDTYNSHMYVGPLGLRAVLETRPHARWFALVDDDTFLDAWSLAQQLEGLQIDTPMCLGTKHWHDCDDGFNIMEDPWLRAGCRGNFSWLGQGYGILCNTAAVRRLYRHLERGPIVTPLRRWGVAYSDVVLGKCMDDLRIPKGHLEYYGAKTPSDFMRGDWGRMHWPVSVHQVRDASEFALLEAFLAPLQAAAARRHRKPPDFSFRKDEQR
eukprot:TRINITY_DN24313_c0_g1_i1.p1 TRINITY_DN24313_c0_g1~~TRINITY_DN24313_c0_g1_i1.p1  ORF type:complete len:437 (-),score=31.63 TRINITY_DN24313_c0_g1_i1:170-1480(-)